MEHTIILWNNTKPRAGEQFLPLDCMAKARLKGMFFSQIPPACRQYDPILSYPIQYDTTLQYIRLMMLYHVV